jgi:long-chain acyl-CoA synthetase
LLHNKRYTLARLLDPSLSRFTVTTPLNPFVNNIIIIMSTAAAAAAAAAAGGKHHKDETDCVWSTVLPHTDRPDRGLIHRCWDASAHPQLGVHGCRTLYEGFRRGASLNPLGPCMGFRAVSTSGFATPYIYATYTECLSRVECLAAGLDVMQLVPLTSAREGKEGEDEWASGKDVFPALKVLGLYTRNCMEWILAEQAAYCLGAATVPLYDTLGPDTVHFIARQTSLKTIVCSRTELPHVCEAKQLGDCPHMKVVLLIDGVTSEAARLAEKAGLEIHSLAKVEAVGARYIATEGPHRHTPPSANDIATFCYTSGTTGDPKGALISHGNLMATISGLVQVNDCMEVSTTDRHLSYLPLAHIFERFVINQMFMGGASVAFFRGDPALLIEDLVACRPTSIIVAPRVLNKIYDKASITYQTSD